MCKKSGLIYRKNAIFEVYRLCLMERIPSSVFLKIKDAINNTRDIPINEILEKQAYFEADD